ncbi:putative Adenylate cyclase 2 [Blattamonas nauphoetae]|uniref:Adenylate cyclase 2 n=1 Tax=Blattamonas nauphoetae TaxID=2049346 RepID=A0ABQ9YCL2_9EUKA|nr:putative Adenylate cyclase 2 [Blattamonas nauphoetae]
MAAFGTRSFEAPEIIKRSGVLRLESSGGIVSNFVITKQYTLLGRNSDNDLAINNGTISKTHALIVQHNLDFYLIDCGSRNKTFVNGKELKNVALYNEYKRTRTLKPPLVSSHQKSASDSDQDSLWEQIKNHDKLRFGNVEYTFFIETLRITPDLPSDKNQMMPKEELEVKGTADDDFRPITDLNDDEEAIRKDYDRLHAAYLFNKAGLESDESQIINNAISVIFKMFPMAESAIVLLVDPKTDELKLETFKERDYDPNKPAAEVPFSMGLAEKVRREKKAILSEDCRADPRWIMTHSMQSLNLCSALSVPLIGKKDEVVGVLILDSTQTSAFQTKDLNLLISVALSIGTAVSNQRMIQQIRTEEKELDMLSRFVSPHLLKTIKASDEILRGSQEIPCATALFADIRGFTAISRNKDPSEIFTFLNEMFDRMVHIVFKYDGLLDKYIGDCMMATWGANLVGSNQTQKPQEMSDGPHTKDKEVRTPSDMAKQAVRAAIDCRNSLRDWNIERKAKNLYEINVGFGLHSGETAAGFVGAEQRMEYTMLGETTKIANDICGIADGGLVVVSERTMDLLKSHPEYSFEAYNRKLDNFPTIKLFKVSYVDLHRSTSDGKKSSSTKRDERKDDKPLDPTETESEKRREGGDIEKKKKKKKKTVNTSDTPPQAPSDS